jgi:hypothetical protein
MHLLIKKGWDRVEANDIPACAKPEGFA